MRDADRPTALDSEASGDERVEISGNLWATVLALCILLPVALLLAVGLAERRIHGLKDGFVGPEACKECHEEQYDSWAETRMAASFEVLKPGEKTKEKRSVDLDPEKDYTRDENCLPCHTTGFGRVGGFVSIEKTPEMAGVTCEACHGPGGRYMETVMDDAEHAKFSTDEVAETGLVYPPTGKVCEKCHNDDSPFIGSGYTFAFKEGVEKGTHAHLELVYEHKD